MTARKGMLLSVCIFLLGGCATRIPPYDLPKDKGGRYSVESIVRRITCELQQITLDNDLNVNLIADNDVNVTMQLSLDVTDDGALAPTFSYMNGVFSFATGATFERSRDQNFTAELSFNMQALAEAARRDLADLHKLSFCDDKFQTDLAGLLGLKRNFDLAATAEPCLNWKAATSDGVSAAPSPLPSSKSLRRPGQLICLHTTRRPAAS